jgi:multidrug resistance efflux pump
LNMKKDRYKAVAGQCSKEIDQLAFKMKELNSQINNTKSEYEVKLAMKDGEINRLEKLLSELRASL